MKTMNRKRIGAVPISLVAVLALAAFLAAGFLTANNAQAAIETDKGECGFSYTDTVGNFTEAPLTTVGGCKVSGNSLTLKIENANDNATGDTDTFAVFVTGGNTFPNVQVTEGSGNNAVMGKKGVARHIIEVARQRTQFGSPTPGVNESITVTRSMAKAGKVIVTIYDSSENLSGLASSSVELPDDGNALLITFLGGPAVNGKDSKVNDRNTIAENFQQCEAPAADDAEADAIADANGDTEDCTTSDNRDSDDTKEILSMVLADTAEMSDGPDADNDPTVAVGTDVTKGKSKRHALGGSGSEIQRSVTITAVVQDANGNSLVGQEVLFEPSNMSPSGVIAARTLSVKTTAAVEAADLNGATLPTAANTGDLGATNSIAIAQQKFTSLPVDSFEFTMKVTAGGETLGTIVVTRSGDLIKVTAEACMMGDNDDDMDGCMKNYKPKNLYGAGANVIIHAEGNDALENKVSSVNWSAEAPTAGTWWNTLDCPQMNDAVMPMEGEPPVGPDDMTSPYCKMYDGLTDEAEAVVDRAFSAYGDADRLVDVSSISFTEGVGEFRIKSNAPGGMYVLIVEGTTGSGDKMRKAADSVYITVSGELVKYIVSGADRIRGGTIQTYKVIAADENGNPAVLSEAQLTNSSSTMTGDQHLVSVFLDDDVAMVRVLGLTANSMLDLGTDAQDTFKIRANRAASGEITITVDGYKDIPVEPEGGKIVVLGPNQAPMGEAIADQTVVVGSDVEVTANFTDDKDTMFTYRAMSSDDMIATAMVDDMGMVTVTGVKAGMATITVYAKDEEMREGMVSFIVTVGMALPEMMAPGMPMSVMATATSDTEIEVTWAAPASDGHSAITGYMVQSKYMMDDGTMSDWMDVDPAHTGTAMMYMDTGLTAETTYYYQVAATNDIGTGKYSDGTATAKTKKPNQPPTAGAAIDAQTVTMGDDPAMVDVSGAFSDADMDVLTYTATSDDPKIATAEVDAMGMVTITAVDAGTATIMVTATDPAGATAKQTFMVTVEAATMELGAPSITSVMSNSAGMAIIMLMPGENADQHWVYAYRTDYKEDYIRSPKAAGDATSVTMSGLTSGMSYWFIAVAGRGEGDDAKWSHWSGWSEATPIQ